MVESIIKIQLESAFCGLYQKVILKKVKLQNKLQFVRWQKRLGYLRSSHVEHGLLINFGAPKFEIKKYALSRIGEASRPGGLIGGTLSLLASLAPFRGWFQSGF